MGFSLSLYTITRSVIMKVVLDYTYITVCLHNDNVLVLNKIDKTCSNDISKCNDIIMSIHILYCRHQCYCQNIGTNLTFKYKVCYMLQYTKFHHLYITSTC